VLALFLVLVASALPAARQTAEVRALWRCEPEEIELGEPFVLVLEVSHPAGVSGRELASGELTLDESWVVLAEEPVASEVLSDGNLRTRRAWRVASLEPGERSLGEALSRVALSAGVTQIQVAAAHVRVSAFLAEGEDAPRPLREFPDDFGGEDETARSLGWVRWLAGSLLLLALGAGAYAWRRRRIPRGATPRCGPLERLAELERSFQEGRLPEGCYELTRLLRSAGDGLRKTPRGGLTDEEWLAEVTASLEVPRNAVSPLAAVFERTGRVKYAGEAVTPWAMQETFAHARAALEVLGTSSTPSAAGTRS
jgi:hypothetical protein